MRIISKPQIFHLNTNLDTSNMAPIFVTEKNQVIETQTDLEKGDGACRKYVVLCPWCEVHPALMDDPRANYWVCAFLLVVVYFALGIFVGYNLAIAKHAG